MEINDCCEKCKGQNHTGSFPAWSLDCPCHSKAPTDITKVGRLDTGTLVTEFYSVDMLETSTNEKLQTYGSTSSITDENWEKEFDTGVALKIGKAGKSKGITNVRKEIKFFIASTVQKEREKAKEESGLFWLQHGKNEGKSEAFSLVRKEAEKIKYRNYLDKAKVLSMVDDLSTLEGK